MAKDIKRIVSTSFWTDGKVDEFTPEDKYFMLYLLTNPFTTQLGIYEISIRQVAFQMGYSPEAVRALLERFENTHGMIIYSKDTNEIAIKNFLVHSIIKGGKPVEDCLRTDIQKVKNKSLISQVFSHISKKDGLNDTVKKIIDEYDIDNENENDNDNDNEDTSTYRQRIVDESSEPKTKPMKHKYGEYKNVLLSDSELDKLKGEYFDWQERIENLSAYIASTGKRYKSHYATIRNWARKDAKESEKPVRGAFYRKQTKADELNDFYAMSAEWAQE